MYRQAVTLWRDGLKFAAAHPSAALLSAARSLAVSPSAAGRSQVDVCIVGAGPAGLAAAVRLKQNSQAEGREVSVLVVEKAKQVGDHTVSGGVFDPCALNELFPQPASDPEAEYGWQALGAPLGTKVRRSRFSVLSSKRRFWFPRPRQLRNRDKYVTEQSRLCRWLADHARTQGVDVWTSCSATATLFDGNKSVVGVEVQRQRDKAMASEGHTISARAVFFAEGAHGVLGEDIIAARKLRDRVGADPQTYALGFREIWDVPAEVHKDGNVEHTVGYPLGSSAYGGGYMYHHSDNRVALGLVVGLDYRNPYLSPFDEFQRWKQHPFVQRVIKDGTCVEFGARTTATGGYQSMPECAFAGGALIGCSAGVANMAQLQGTHLAMKTGMLAADAAFGELSRGEPDASAPLHMQAYNRSLRDSWVVTELKQAQNVRPGFRWGLWLGLLNAAVQTNVFPLLLGGTPWRMQHRYRDREMTQTTGACKKIDYGKSDSVSASERATAVERAGLPSCHTESHIVQTSPRALQRASIEFYDHIERRICPAGVFEYHQDSATNAVSLHVDPSKCLHCMACSIKDPTSNIVLKAPIPGTGPVYGR